MKVYEIVSLNRELLKRLHGFGIETKDYRYTGLFGEYLEMKMKGHKTSYIVAVLSQSYNICERTVYKVIKTLRNK